MTKTHQKEQKVIKLRYSREKKETDENVSTSKENKDKVINNKGNKGIALNSKADDNISKSRGTVKRPFSESDADQSDSLKKRKLIAMVFLCEKQNSIVNGVKSVHSTMQRRSSCLLLFSLHVCTENKSCLH